MGDYFTLLAARIHGAAESVRPVLPGRFEPPPSGRVAPPESMPLTGEAVAFSAREAGAQLDNYWATDSPSAHSAPALGPIPREQTAAREGTMRPGPAPTALPADDLLSRRWALNLERNIRTPPADDSGRGSRAEVAASADIGPHDANRGAVHGDARSDAAPVPPPGSSLPPAAPPFSLFAQDPDTRSSLMPAVSSRRVRSSLGDDEPAPRQKLRSTETADAPRERVRPRANASLPRPEGPGWSPSPPAPAPIHITIGRIEVQAVYTPPPAPPPAPRRAPAANLTLESYLAGRGGAGSP